MHFISALSKIKYSPGLMPSDTRCARGRVLANRLQAQAGAAAATAGWHVAGCGPDVLQDCSAISNLSYKQGPSHTATRYEQKRGQSASSAQLQGTCWLLAGLDDVGQMNWSNELIANAASHCLPVAKVVRYVRTWGL
eukprot:351580-Chlamydomonas_euryale.AAC.3